MSTYYSRIGLVYPEHAVPNDAIVLSLRYCKGCGRLMAANSKMCLACHAEPTQPPIERMTTLSILEELMQGEHPLAL